MGAIESIRDITEMKVAEEALQESEERFRFLTENLADIVWTVDLSFRTTYVSPSITKVLGFTPGGAKKTAHSRNDDPGIFEIAHGVIC